VLAWRCHHIFDLSSDFNLDFQQQQHACHLERSRDVHLCFHEDYFRLQQQHDSPSHRQWYGDMVRQPFLWR
jgi:hypothetical protein